MTDRDTLRASSRDANRRRRMAESTVEIPTLSAAMRRKREALEKDSEAWVWEMCGPKSGIRQPLVRTFTAQQSQMIHAYEETLKHGGDEMMLASRGEGKTTYLRAMIWMSVAIGAVDFVALIGATGNDAKNSCDAIKDNIVRSDPFLRLYPEIAIPCRAVGSTSQLANSMRATGRQFDDPKRRFEQEPISFTWSSDINLPDVPGSPSAGAMMRFCGADSPIRGLNILGKRPKVVAIDDLDNLLTVNNPDVAKKVIDEVDTSIGGLGTPTDPMARIMLATLPKQGCGVAHHYATQGFPFVVHTFRYLESKPVAWEMWMEYVKLRQRGKAEGDKYGRHAHRFYLNHREAMDEGAVVSNPFRFKTGKLPDGSVAQVSALQNYFDEWADKGEMFCRCELDNEIVQAEQRIESQLEIGHVLSCESDVPRERVETSTTMIVRGIDVRKIELHSSTLATDCECRHRVIDYDVHSHGTSETTVEQAESLILSNLHLLADHWESERYIDQNNGEHSCDLTLIDKGWLGSWNEDGETKSWAAQPVERFCMERGLRRWLPAKGQPNYKTPQPSDTCIIGDNWHMNRGAGAERSCTEVVWSAEHWHSLVAELFMLADDDPHRFALFMATEGVWVNHKRLSEHIREGSQEQAELRRKGTRTRKPKFRRDHWWDSFAMMLVARSIEEWFRENLAKSVKPIRGRSMPLVHEELGAR